MAAFCLSKAHFVPIAVIFMLLVVPIPAYAQKQPSSVSPVVPVEMANSQCVVRSVITTCGGAWNATQTFVSKLSRGEIVTVAFAYLYGNSDAARLGFFDTLGNSPHVVSSQCTNSSPPVCTAIGYFQVVKPGYDDVKFTEKGGSTGEMWYNAEIWRTPTGGAKAIGASSSCTQACTSQLAIGPLQKGISTTLIAVSMYVAFYPHTPASWQFSYPYWYSATDYDPVGGDSVAWQGTTTVLQSFTFSASTGPTPNLWAGSGEVISLP